MEDLIKKCCADVRNKFAGAKTPELEARALDMLPDANEYKLIEMNGTVEKFRVKTLANIPSENEFILICSTLCVLFEF